MGGDYPAAVEGSLAKEFKVHNLPRADSWHLLMIAVDTDQQGAGAALTMCPCAILTDAG